MTITMRIATPAASVASLLAEKKLFLAGTEEKLRESFKKAETPLCACALLVQQVILL